MQEKTIKVSGDALAGACIVVVSQEVLEFVNVLGSLLKQPTCETTLRMLLPGVGSRALGEGMNTGFDAAAR